MIGREIVLVTAKAIKKDNKSMIKVTVSSWIFKVLVTALTGVITALSKINRSSPSREEAIRPTTRLSRSPLNRGSNQLSSEKKVSFLFAGYFAFF